MAEPSGMQRALTPRRWGEVEMEPRPGPETEEELLAREAEPPPPEPETPLAPEPAPPEPSTRFKYKSQEEAERAYTEAQRRMHEATAEAAAIRKRQEELEHELEALRQSRQQAPQAPQAPARKPGETLKAYVARVRALDPDAEDYDERYAEIWEEGMRQFIAPDIEQLIEQRGEAVAQRIVEQRFKDFEQRQTTQQRQKTEQERFLEEVALEAKSMGLDLGPEGDPDVVDFFWTVAAKRADERQWDDSATMRDKIAFAVERTKRFAGVTPAPPVSPETPPSNGASGQSSVPPDVRRPVPPMGRQTSSAPSGVGEAEEPVQPRSLGAILESQQMRRRI